MKFSGEGENKFTELRRRAEEYLQQRGIETREDSDFARLLHELEVYHAELETQNEELSRAQQELTNIKDRYQRLFDQAPVGYFLLDDKTIIREVNRAGTEILRSPGERITNSSLYNYITDSSAEHLHRHFQKLLSGEEPQSCELELKRPGEEQGFGVVESFFAQGSFDSRRYILTTMRDISLRKQRERELAESSQAYSDLVEMAGSIIATMDTEGRLTFMNQYGLDMLGYRKGELIGKPALGTITPEYDTNGYNMAEKFAEMLAAPDSCSIVETENLRVDGSRIWCSWSNRPITDKWGKVVGILGVGQDITSRKEAEDVLHRDNEMLETMVEERTRMLMEAQEKADRAKRLADLGRLSATIAHELRRPLAAIKLSLYNIRRKQPPAELERHLSNCEQKLSEGNKIIQHILDSSTLKAPNLEHIDLAELIDSCVHELEELYPNETGIRRDLEELRGIEVPIDPQQLREVFYNLLQNAFDATDSRMDLIYIRGFCTTETFGFVIEDSDEGITEEEIEKITDPFYTTKATGIGLGLTLAQEMVRMHEGALDISSTLGRGTAVTVTLPLHPSGSK